MVEFLRTFLTPIVALVALIQPWVIVLWKRFFRRGSLDIYETGRIVIGYENFGAMVMLKGSLRAFNKEIFVRSMDLLVVREKDKSQHTFQWYAFASPQIDWTAIREESMETPCGFLVSPAFPQSYSIIFNDVIMFTEIEPMLSKYISEWSKVVVDKLEKIQVPPPEIQGDSPKIAKYRRMFSERIVRQESEAIDEFRKSQIHVNTYIELDRKCYWEAGEYRLTLNVRTSKPDRVFAKRFGFSLTEIDARYLKLNAINMLEVPISRYFGISNLPYHYARAMYKPS